MTRSCEYCHKIMHGRSDKKFCNDQCRNNHHNDLKGTSSKLVRTINHALGRNRRIIQHLLPANCETIKIKKEKLIKEGYNFNYHTHSYQTQNGKTYSFCYDMGYLLLDNGIVLLVRNKIE